jgi:hypothetical protein
MLDHVSTTVTDRKLCLFGCACCRRIWRFVVDDRSRLAVERAELYVDGLISAKELEMAWNGACDARSGRATEQHNLAVTLEGAIKALWRLDSDEQSAAELVGHLPESTLLAFGSTVAAEQVDDRPSVFNRLRGKLENLNDRNQAGLLLNALQAKLELQEEPDLTRAVEAERRALSECLAAVAVSRLVWGMLNNQELLSVARAVAKYAAKVGSATNESQVQGSVLRDLVGNFTRIPTPEKSWLEWKDGMVVETARLIYQNRHFDQLPRLGDLLRSAGCNEQEWITHCFSESEHFLGCWVIDSLLGK